MIEQIESLQSVDSSSSKKKKNRLGYRKDVVVRQFFDLHFHEIQAFCLVCFMMPEQILLQHLVCVFEKQPNSRM